jgi:protein SCO1/2
MRRLVGHPLFAPGLAIAAFGWGAGLVALLRFGPGWTPWIDTLLTVCFGWNAEARHYRLDSLLLALLQPPLFVAVVAFFYADELRAFLRSRRNRVVAVLVPSVFLALAAYLLATGDVSASGVPPRPGDLVTPIRQGTRAPAFELVDHRGARVTAESFRGRPVVLTFVYASCHSACPLLIDRLRALERRVGAADIAFVAVTLDPERDTPTALAAHAARWGLGPRWHLLTGPAADVRRLVAAYRIQWAPLPDGEIAHENIVTLIDRAGRVAFTYRGVGVPEDRQAADLRHLLAERA